MRFGPVAVLNQKLKEYPFDFDVHEVSGIHPGTKVAVGSNFLAASLEDGKELPSDIPLEPYLLVAAHIGTVRMRRDWLMHRINGFANLAIDGSLTSTEAVKLLDESVHLQQDSVHFYANFTGRTLFSNSAESLFLSSVLEFTSSNQKDLETLSVAIDNLDHFVGNVFAAASFRAQRDLNRVGFFLGLLTVIFSAVALGTLVSVGTSGFTLVIVAWLLTTVIVASAFRLERLRTFSSVRQATTRIPKTR